MPELASLRNRYVLAWFYVSLFYLLIVVSSLLFTSPSIDKSCTCNMSSAPPASISL